MFNKILRKIFKLFKIKEIENNRKIEKNKKRADNSPPDDIYPLW